ncbi:MAG: selenide, water dikinase SelD [Syntrophorhabdaceae bacterium]|nr:selenide, water dikinase SelD [Syntrophorhabdaceae bacterium]
MGPGDLSNILCGIDIPSDSNVIAGIEGFEDAGVYRITEEVAIVQTVDFFTPIVNDPYSFGQIAAANSLSDIYAMGATPKTALNIVCFSVKKYGSSALKEIIRGGIDKIREAGVSLLGGHSVEDEEIKYGLCVTGVVHPHRVLRNEGACEDDYLILTKPLGTGILNTGIKADMLNAKSIENLVRIMATLNRDAARAMLSVKTHAATDVTGFGLVGHLKEMIKDDLGVVLYAKNIPYLEEAPELANIGMLPGGLYRNRDFYGEHVIGEKTGFIFDVIFDPQTSGGLLFAIHPDDLSQFEQNACLFPIEYWVIGRFIKEPKGKIIIQ